MEFIIEYQLKTLDTIIIFEIVLMNNLFWINQNNLIK